MVKAAVISGSFEPNQLVEVKDIPKPPIKDDEILIKSVAFAINPTDWKHIVYELGKKGDVVGCDVSGVIEDVGSKVTNFKKGDVVSTFITGNRSPITGAFSEYVAVNPATTIKYSPNQLNNPPNVQSSTIQSFEGAASVNLSLVTVGLSFSHYLQLDQSSQKGDTILIWGGATATGIIAIQIAKQIYQLNVITTASKKNHEFLKQLGADYVFDYNDPDVVDKIKKTGPVKFALDIISTPETFQQTYEATEGNSEVYIDSLAGLDYRSITVDKNREGDSLHWGNTIACLASLNEKDVFNKHYVQTPELLEDFTNWWSTVIPRIIDTIRHPNLKILENGLDSVNEGLELSRNHEVSAEKVIFRVQ
ncbi:hypothetical protein SBY92_003959 [Candida maltosa Xu316]|uniref:Putative zinc-binding dehydrogenase n=1 Tax=Candida maltosa (strain Xu316) TaxID=1245528 RepID=M3IQA7_CANMX|nr:putative zinc-binding dehydrogenase [Candida maltosa Xu316]